MKSHFSLFLASGTFFLCGLLGCANPQKSPFGDADVVLENAADVGMVSVKAFPPLSFATIQSKLAPNIAITTEEARRDALSATMYDDVNYADRIKSILQLGLQNTTREQTTTSETGKENQTKTITSTSPGVLPEKADQDQVLAAALRTLTPPSIADAFLSYSSITGLKQYAGWLDNYLSGISIPDEYQASLVTFQISAQPIRPNLPVDSYVDITIWPSMGNLKKIPPEISIEKLPMVMVFPILMTDNLEANSRNLRAAHDRNSGVTVAGTNRNTAALFDFGSSSSSERQRLGQDLNGVTTMAIQDNNHIRVRLGAQAQVSAGTGFGMVSRSHILTALVVTHRKLVSLDVITQNHFVDVRSGKILCDKGANLDCRNGTMKLAQDFGFSIKECSELNDRIDESPKNHKASADRIDLWRDVGGLIRNVHAVSLFNCLEPTRKVLDREWTRFFASVVAPRNQTELTSFILPIPHSTVPTFPNGNQTVMLKTSSESVKAFIRGGQGLTKDKLFAYWITSDRKKIAAERITIGEGGSDITLDFPGCTPAGNLNGNESIVLSMTHWQENKNEDKRKYFSLPDCDIRLYATHRDDCGTFNGVDRENSSEDDNPSPLSEKTYVAFRQKIEEKSAPMTNPLSVDAGTILATYEGRGQLIVRLTEKQKSPVTVSIRGADLMGYTGNGEANPAGVMLRSEGTTKFALGNLSALNRVEILAHVENKPVGSPISIPVVILPPRVEEKLP